MQRMQFKSLRCRFKGLLQSEARLTFAEFQCLIEEPRLCDSISFPLIVLSTAVVLQRESWKCFAGTGTFGNLGGGLVRPQSMLLLLILAQRAMPRPVSAKAGAFQFYQCMESFANGNEIHELFAD